MSETPAKSVMQDGLAFERPLVELQQKIDELKKLKQETHLDLDGEIELLEERKRREADAAAAKLAEEQRAALASQSEAVGTFSSVGLGGMGFGSSLHDDVHDFSSRKPGNAHAG